MARWTTAALVLLVLVGASGAPVRAGALDDLNTGLALDDISSGLAARERGDQDGAIKRYSHAIESGGLDNPNLAIAYNNRANAYDDKGDSERALEDYNQAIRLDPRLAEAYYNRGYALYRLGRPQDALRDYDKVVSLLPELPSAYFNRSIVLLALNEKPKAIEDLRKALQLDPTNTKYRDQYNLLQASEVKRP